ncbi:hypothetical protein Dimus_003350 [Dionaea muscipula]
MRREEVKAEEFRVGETPKSGGEIYSVIPMLGVSDHVMSDQIKDIQQQGSAAAAKIETERLKQDLKRAMQLVQ